MSQTSRNRYLRPDYDPDCGACLRGLYHTIEQHEAAVNRALDSSSPDYGEAAD